MLKYGGRVYQIAVGFSVVLAALTGALLLTPREFLDVHPAELCVRIGVILLPGLYIAMEEYDSR